MTPPFPFIVGAPRSGTTLLRLMLDAHPELAIPPETGFLHLAHQLQWTDELSADAFVELLSNFPPEAPGWRDFGISTASFRSTLPARLSVQSGLVAFYRMYAARFDKPRAGDKTPSHATCMAETARHWPGARFIHLIRDGRDVALSWRLMWFAPSQDLEALGAAWADLVRDARNQSRDVSHYLEVRFEALVAQPEAELRRICAFLDLSFDARMLAHDRGAAIRLAEHQSRHRPDGTELVSREQRFAQQRLAIEKARPERIEAWRRGMRPEELTACMAGASSMLVELGYEAAESGDPSIAGR